MRQCRCVAPAVVALVVLTGCLGEQKGVPTRRAAASQPASLAPASETTDRVVDAAEIVRMLADDESLRLFTGAENSPKRFTFSVWLSVPNHTGKPLATDFLVARDGDRLAILATSRDGLPFCYMTNGVFAVFDRVQRGQLLVFEGGHPAFVLGATRDENKMEFSVAQVRRADMSGISLDIGSLLRGSLKKLVRATADSKVHTITLRAEHSLLMIRLPPAGEAGRVPVQGLMFVAADGSTIAVTDIRIDKDPPLDLFNLKAPSLKELGMPVRILREPEARGLSPMVPPDFGTDPRERAAAEKLASLFPVSGRY